MYKVTTDEQSQPQINALPAEALVPFAEVRTMMELAPWNGSPYNDERPESPMRGVSFGPNNEGDVVYLILDDQRRVDILVVIWI